MRVGDPAIRLSPGEQAGIRQALEKVCAESGTAWRRVILFGSRSDPSRRGGDIDLLVELDPSRSCDTYRFKNRLRLAIEDAIGEQHVDLVIDCGEPDNAFAALARSQGVELWSTT